MESKGIIMQEIMDHSIIPEMENSFLETTQSMINKVKYLEERFPSQNRESIIKALS